jgi:pSer/pThr/pTyr-binding forkhead associated (FHA) protein
MSALASPESLQVQNTDAPGAATAFLVDLVSNRKIPITTPRCKVGRDDLNDIVISGDQSISRFHFVITRDNGQYYVQDGKSRHGTFLNGNQISGPEPIHDGDVLKVGVSLFWFVIEAQTAAAGDKPAPVDVASSQQQHELEFVPHDTQGAPAGMAAAAASAVNNEQTITPQAAEWAAAADKANRPPTETATNLPQQLAPGDQLTELSPGRAGKTQDMPQPKFPGSAESQGDESAEEDKDQTTLQILKDQIEAAANQEEEKDDEEDKDQTTLQIHRDQIEAAANQEEKEETPAPEEPPTAESNLGDIEYQFGIAEDNIAKAAESISGRFADQQAEAAAEPAPATADEETPEPKAQETLEKFAEIVGEAKGNEEKKTLSQYLNFASGDKEAEPASSEPQAERIETLSASSNNQHEDDETNNGAKSVMSIKESASANVPDWCKKYFSAELNHLDKEMNELNDQVRQLQNRIKDVESRVSMTKGLRNILLTAQGDDLVEACSKVLGLIGWRVRHSEEDKNELRLETDDKNICIARIVWTEKEPDRSHLGQLSIAQTRYWCEQGVEPKGILLISRGNENANSGEYATELAEYASKKNVCLMSTPQLLAVYKEIALHDGSAETVRNTIQAASGWLHGFSLESEQESSGSTNKLSSLLSA